MSSASTDPQTAPGTRTPGFREPWSHRRYDGSGRPSAVRSRTERTAPRRWRAIAADCHRRSTRVRSGALAAKRLDIDLTPIRLVGIVGDPLAVRGKLPVLFHSRCLTTGRRASAGRHTQTLRLPGSLDGYRPQVGPRLRIEVSIQQQASVGRKIVRSLSPGTGQQALRVAAGQRALVQIANTIAQAGVHEHVAVARPHGEAVAGIRRKTSARAALGFHHPQSVVADGQPPAIR